MKTIVFILVFISCVFSIKAQEEMTAEEFSRMSQPRHNAKSKPQTGKPKPKPLNNRKKYSINGNIGMTFGYYTAINFAPQIGYNISDKVTVGTGLGFSYYKEDYRGEMFKNTYLSYNLFSRFYPIPNLVFHIQPEVSRVWWTYERGTVHQSDSKFVPNFLVGAGYRYNGLVAMLQYDVIQNKDSQYGKSLFYSVGYSFNF